MNRLTKTALIAGSTLVALLSVTGPVFAADTMMPATDKKMMATKWVWGEASWMPAAGAVKYHVFYKMSTDKTWMYSVRDLASTSTKVNLGHLWGGKKWVYKVAAVDGSGKIFWWSEEKTLKTWAMK